MTFYQIPSANDDVTTFSQHDHWCIDKISISILRVLIFAEATLDTFMAMIRSMPLGDIYPKSMWIGIHGM